MLNFAASLAFYGAIIMVLVVGPCILAYATLCIVRNWQLNRHLNALRQRLGACPSSNVAPWSKRGWK